MISSQHFNANSIISPCFNVYHNTDMLPKRNWSSS
jgi:hypothetical protein